MSNNKNQVNRDLNAEQQFMINQVTATMAIENMHLTEQALQNLIDVATGRKTTEQVSAEIIARYSKAGNKDEV